MTGATAARTAVENLERDFEQLEVRWRQYAAEMSEHLSDEAREHETFGWWSAELDRLYQPTLESVGADVRRVMAVTWHLDQVEDKQGAVASFLADCDVEGAAMHLGRTAIELFDLVVALLKIDGAAALAQRATGLDSDLSGELIDVLKEVVHDREAYDEAEMAVRGRVSLQQIERISELVLKKKARAARAHARSQR